MTQSEPIRLAYGPQLHISSVADLTPVLSPVQNDGWVKPKYGFWTSSFVGETSDWVKWCEAESFGCPYERNWFVLSPRPGVRIYHIDGVSDLDRAIRRYGVELKIESYRKLHIDFERMAMDYDGLHLTERGQWKTRFSTPVDLYGWDCESTVWFRWAFASYERIATPKPRAEEAVA